MGSLIFYFTNLHDYGIKDFRNIHGVHELDGKRRASMWFDMGSRIIST